MKELDPRIKAMGLSFLLVLVMAGVKFALYYLSGSLVVYAEAWHSLSDVLTSLVVLGVVAYSAWKGEREAPQGPPHGLGWISSFLASPEHLASVLIGLILFGVALGVVRASLFSSPPKVHDPLLVGVVFLVLSVGSYFIYRFQDYSSAHTGSAALAADGQHNRADSLVSLFTGISLLIEAAGLRVDRWAALVLSVLLFSISLSLIFSAFVAVAQKGRHVGEYEALVMVLRWLVLGPWWLVRRLVSLLPEGSARLVMRWGSWLLVLLVLALWGSTAAFSVAPDEVAFVLRFGRPVSSTPYGPGLHLKAPWPVDSVVRIRPHKIRTVYVGNLPAQAAPPKKAAPTSHPSTQKTRSKFASLRLGKVILTKEKLKKKSGPALPKTPTVVRARLWSRWHGDTPYLITGDSNVLYVYMGVEFDVSDPFMFLFGASDPTTAVTREARAALTKVLATMPLYGVLLDERKRIEDGVKSFLQERISGLGIGVRILRAYVIDVHPPPEIAEAFEQVIAAYQIQEKRLFDARAHEHKVLARARLASVSSLAGSEAAKKERIEEAEGIAAAFGARAAAFLNAPEAVGLQLRWERLERLLAGKKTVVVDPRSRIPSTVLYMEFMGRRAKRK